MDLQSRKGVKSVQFKVWKRADLNFIYDWRLNQAQKNHSIALCNTQFLLKISKVLLRHHVIYTSGASIFDEIIK